MKKMKKKILIITLLLVFLLAAGAAVYVNLYNQYERNKPAATGETIILDENGNALDGNYNTKTKEQILSDLQKAQVTVTDKISSSAIFENGTKGSIGSWIVENLPENNVVMQCEIYDGEKLLAKSVPILPNQHIERIELLEHVEIGSHDVTAYINYFKLDTKVYISKAGYKINLTIKN